MATSSIRAGVLTALLALASCDRQQGMTNKSFGPDADADGHVAATQTTASLNAAVGAELPLNDPAEFEDAKRGFIATDDPLVTTTATVQWSGTDPRTTSSRAPPHRA